MYTVDVCPCCLSNKSTARWAIVAPFLAHFAVGKPPFLCRLLDCSVCSFRFFDARLEPAEVERLYSGYRGEKYFAARHRYEFWYSRKVNDGIGGDPQEIVLRVSALDDFVRPHVTQAAVKTVLDYGGDRGQFIPQSAGSEKFVFELSDAVPVAGVTRIATEQQLSQMKFDFIMSMGVLEHCSEPGEILDKLRSCMNPRALLCVGVPFERYNITFAGKSRLYRAYLKALLHVSPALTAVDFYSATSRIRLHCIPPLGLAKCHEHLNFFNLPSMTALLNRSGFEVVDSDVKRVAKYPAKVDSLYIVARLR